MAYNISSLMAQFQSKEAQARAANLKREQELRGMYEKIEARYAPGGAFEVGGRAEIETAKTRGVGQEMQQLISSGMYGTTTAAGIPSRWEAEVGTPARLKLEDISMQRLTQAEQAKAGFIERIQEPYPDYGPLMQAIQAASAVGGGAGGGAVGGPTSARGVSLSPSFQRSYDTGGYTGGYGAAAPAAPTAARAAAPTAGAVVKPTVAEQYTIDQRLKAQYPQMYKPGWGTTPTKATTTKPASWWSKIGTAFGGGF